MKKLLKLMGNPEKQLRFIHVAGTKGKGSTCAMVDSILRTCGYAVGLYTSPHIVDMRERIQINGQVITQAEFTPIMRLIKTRTRAMGEDRPTYFEILTAAAFCHFADQAVDIVVLETGLGGRLDSTNVVKPLVSAITQISMDHTNVLGRTLEEIAREKAGIFKPGVPAISCEQAPAVQKVLQEVAAEVGATLEFTGQQIEFSSRFEADKERGPHMRVCLSTANAQYEHLPVPLPGEHQALNCSIALAIIDKLRLKGFDLPDDKLARGLASTRIAGRMEMAWQEPRVLLDVAHNPASIKALIKSIGAHIPYDSLVVIFSIAADKDVKAVLKEIELGADKVIFVKSRTNPRAMDPADLQAIFAEVSDNKMAQVADSLEEAFNLAVRAVSREDLICVTGSFVLVGEAKRYLGTLADKRLKRLKSK